MLSQPLALSAQTTILSEGFEGAFPGGNAWGVGDANLSGPTAHWDDVNLAFGGEGTHDGGWKGYCAGYGYGGTIPAPTYQSDMTSFMERAIDLLNFGSATLRFWHKIPGIETCCDQARVFVGGSLIWSESSAVPDWTEVVLDLGAYVGTLPVLRFEFYSDGSVVEEGWYLDDILVTGVQAPSNDNCVNARVLSDGVPYSMDTTGATSNDYTPPPCQPNFGKGVWFKFTAPADGLVEVSTCGSSFDTVLDVSVDWCGNNRQILACSDDNGPLCAGYNASVQFSVPAGIYRIRAGGYNSLSGTLTITARWRDTIPPVITCPNNIAVQCLENVPSRPTTLLQFQQHGGQAGDNWDMDLSYSSNDGPFTGGPCAGIILRTHTVMDDAGNSASCVQVITVMDTIPPFITCPPNFTVQCVGDVPRRPTTMAEFLAQGGRAGDNCDTRLNYICADGPLVGGPCGGTINRTHTVIDDCTNVASCIQLITVCDTVPPTILCPANLVTNTDPGQCTRSNVTALLSSPLIVSDNCGVANVYTSPGFEDYATQFPVGVTLVTVTAIDPAGNSNRCTFTVTILDTEPPNIHCPAAFFTFTEPGQCERTNVIYPVFASDNRSGGVAWCEPPSGSTLPRGTTLVRCVARDAAGNTNSCAFPVTISGFESRETDFAVLPPGSVMTGNAYLGGDGVLHLTDAVNGQQGTFLFPLWQPVGSFRASFRALVGDSTSANPADGFSFCVASDLAAPFDEEGSGTGLIVSFDTFRNPGEEAPAIDLKWNGTPFAHANWRIITGEPAAFVDVFIELTPAGQVTVRYGGVTAHDAVPIPGFHLIPGQVAFGFGARTGSSNAKHWIDDLHISDDALCAGPCLVIVRSNATVVVSWPQPASGWLLQGGTNLVAGAVWANFPPPYQTNGTNLQFSESVSAGRKFYRLHKP